MTVHTYLRTKDLARAAQISVQQVRNYEASGLIPPYAYISELLDAVDIIV